MVVPYGMVAGLRRVALVALAEIPLVIILVVIIPGLALQPFLPGGFTRLQVLLKTVNASVTGVLAATLEQGGKVTQPAVNARRHGRKGSRPGSGPGRARGSRS